MKLSLFDLILLLGSAQGFFIAFLLSKRRVANRPAAIYLTALVVLVSILLFARLSFQAEWLVEYPYVILLPDLILFSFGPCMWLFIRHLLRLPTLSRRALWWHASPALFYITVVNLFLGLHLSGTLEWLDQRQIIISFYLIEGAGVVSLLVYLFASLRQVQRSQLTSEQPGYHSAVDRFLPLFFRVGLVLVGCWTVSFFFHIFFFDPAYVAYRIFWLLLVAYLYWLAYVAVLKKELFDLPTAAMRRQKTDASTVERIQRFMDEQQPFLEPGLKLGDLATLLDLPRHELSQVLNQDFGQSFFDFVNAYRIQAFITRRRGPQGQQQSILQQAYEVGFNSKSAFNRAFRKATGESPRDFFKRSSQDSVSSS